MHVGAADDGVAGPGEFETLGGRQGNDLGLEPGDGLLIGWGDEGGGEGEEKELKRAVAAEEAVGDFGGGGGADDTDQGSRAVGRLGDGVFELRGEGEVGLGQTAGTVEQKDGGGLVPLVGPDFADGSACLGAFGVIGDEPGLTLRRQSGEIRGEGDDRDGDHQPSEHEAPGVVADRPTQGLHGHVVSQGPVW